VAKTLLDLGHLWVDLVVKKVHLNRPPASSEAADEKRAPAPAVASREVEAVSSGASRDREHIAP
jgi:hypothetical protein